MNRDTHGRFMTPDYHDGDVGALFGPVIREEAALLPLWQRAAPVLEKLRRPERDVAPPRSA